MPILIHGSGGNRDINLQDVTAKSSDRFYYITPDEGYDGIGKVTVAQMNLQSKTISPSINEQLVKPDTLYDGLDKVTVGAVMLQEKTVNPTSSEQIVTPDSNYVGLSKVTVSAMSAGGSSSEKIEFTPDEIEYAYQRSASSKDYIAFNIARDAINGFAMLYKGYTLSGTSYTSGIGDYCFVSLVTPNDAFANPVTYSKWLNGSPSTAKCYYAVLSYKSSGSYFISQRMFFLSGGCLYIFPDRKTSTATASSIVDYMAEGKYDLIYW